MATHSNILAWRIPRSEEPGGLQSIGSQRVKPNWSWLSSSSKYLLTFRICCYFPSSCLVKDSKAPHQLGLSSSVPGPTVKSSTSNNPEWRYMQRYELLPPSCLMLTEVYYGLQLWHLSPTTSDSLSGGFPDLKTCFPCLLPPLKLLNEDLSKSLSEWAVLLRSVCSDPQEREVRWLSRKEFPCFLFYPQQVSSPPGWTPNKPEERLLEDDPESWGISIQIPTDIKGENLFPTLLWRGCWNATALVKMVKNNEGLVSSVSKGTTPNPWTAASPGSSGERTFAANAHSLWLQDFRPPFREVALDPVKAGRNLFSPVA